jgi:hypothetical protein
VYVYTRIADRTAADWYFAAIEKVEALSGQPNQLASDDEGREMRELGTELHRRMLGNGCCDGRSRWTATSSPLPHFFVTAIEFRRTLQRQRDGAARKGQIARQKIFDGVLNRPRHRRLVTRSPTQEQPPPIQQGLGGLSPDKYEAARHAGQHQPQPATVQPEGADPR